MKGLDPSSRPQIVEAIITNYEMTFLVQLVEFQRYLDKIKRMPSAFTSNLFLDL